MAVLGIVAEFNPFHNGHLHLINEMKSQYNFSAIVCVMSGNFTQRGEPALCNKWSRAEMALQNGVDIVIELPFIFATRSAYYFAKGAISLLASTGVITHLAFGSEVNDIKLLQPIALLLNDEPDEYKNILTEYLAKGLNYPVARSKSLQEYFNNPEMAEILSGSNNILGIEYLRVLAELNAPITPITLKRQGSSYHSTTLSEFASATAIRQAVYNNKSLEELDFAIPLATKSILAREITEGRAPIDLDIWAQAIFARLRIMAEEDIEKLYDVTEGLEARIVEKAITTANIEELKLAIKSKRYNYTRINRILLYSLFNITKSLVAELDNYSPLYYHILGFTNKGQEILGQIKQNSDIPILNRGRDVKMLYDKKDTPQGKMLKLDVTATNFYNLLYPNMKQRIGGTDFTTSPIML